MTELQFEELIERMQAGQASVEEIAMIEQWLENRGLRNLYGNLPAEEKEAIRTELLQNIIAKIRTEPLKIESIAFSRGRSKLIYKMAASILIVISIGIYMLINTDNQARLGDNKIDVAPGSNKAIIKLADGSTIDLNNAEKGALTSQGGTSIYKTGEGEVAYYPIESNINPSTYNTIIIPRGGQYKIVLSDGTKVWLNAESSLKYPITFNGDVRQVELTGEAYFEVAENKKMPFRVKALSQEVEVLGTHFNINTYSDEVGARTTLVKGSVKVSNSSSTQILKPGQQSMAFFSGSEITVQNVNAEDALAWKNGFFQFKNTSIQEVMRQLARWYDVEVEYEGPVTSKNISGKMYRNVNASQALEILSYLKIHYRIEQQEQKKKIVITPLVKNSIL